MPAVPSDDKALPTPHVPSPCISVCVIDAKTGWCTGCLRTLDEIALWSVLEDSEKRAVLSMLDLRRSASDPITDPSGTRTDDDR